MKRRPPILLKLIVFIVLGAIVNVAVAWGLSLRSSWPSGQVLYADQEAVDWWHENAPIGFPDAPRSMHRVHRFGSARLSLHECPPGPNADYSAFNIAHGWPLPSLESTNWVDRKTNIKLLRGAIQWGDPPAPNRRFPFGATWPGFAINTIFYAAILWMLFAAPLALRRYVGGRRIKRGLCPACAYDLRGSLGGSQNCPECGTPVQSKSAV